MSASKRAAGRLEIAEDLALQRRAWVFERVGWIVFAVVLLAAVVGLFGGGVVGDAEVSAADGALAVEYPRFARAHSPLSIRVRLEPAQPTDGELRLWMSREYAARLDIDHVSPPPSRTELGAERIEFVFPWRGPPGPAAVTFVLEADAGGSVRGRIGAGDGDGVPVRHLLYP